MAVDNLLGSCVCLSTMILSTVLADFSFKSINNPVKIGRKGVNMMKESFSYVTTSIMNSITASYICQLP